MADAGAQAPEFQHTALGSYGNCGNWLGRSFGHRRPAVLFLGYFNGFIDALFESVSGFTTTGASILDNIESLPTSLLLWRSLTHWIGGMGIIILALVVLPAINVSGRNLYNFESSSLANEQITPKIKDTARLLWTVYFALTAVETALLLILGLPFFDAFLTAMATIATVVFHHGTPASPLITVFLWKWSSLFLWCFPGSTSPCIPN
jgi:Trk-type K+ transport system membrane component